jgi:hypothetical protein
MKVTRVYTGADDQSPFDEIEVEIAKLQPGHGIVFRHESADHVQGWHRAPRLHYVINLSGESEVEIGDGTKRRFGPGDIFLADDTSGHGQDNTMLFGRNKNSHTSHLRIRARPALDLFLGVTSKSF